MAKQKPSMDVWYEEIRSISDAEKIGMILTHNGIVRKTPKALVRNGTDDGTSVVGMDFSYDQSSVDRFVALTEALSGIYFVRVWLNCGHLMPGDDLMVVMIGGDIRPNVMTAMSFLLDSLKNQCVTEIEVTQ